MTHDPESNSDRSDNSKHDGDEEKETASDDVIELSSHKKDISIAEQLSPVREVFFVSIICLAQLMTQVSLGQTLAILHVIGDSFGVTNPVELPWLIAGYSLTVGTFILVAGRFGDVYGYKKMLLLGFSWFALWTLISGLAVFANEILFVFSRVMTGIGPAFCLPNALAILGASYNNGPRKHMVFAFFGAVAPGGSILGAAFSGLFTLTWWPWAYWSTAITLVGIVVAGYFVIPELPRPVRAADVPLMGLVQELDLPGAFLGVTSLVLINFAWNQAPIVGWSEPYVYTLLIIGILLIPAFFFYELRFASNPLIPFHALSADVGFVLLCIACGWGSFGIWIFYGWQIIEELRGVSPLLGAAYFSPAAISGALAAVATGILLSKMKPAWVMVCALVCFLIGNILIATFPVYQNYWAQFFVASVITPWGMDMSFPSGTIILSNAVKREHQGIAASLVNTVVNYSISMALGFAGTVEVHIQGDAKSPAAVLRGYRSALYLSTGLSALGLMIAFMFVIKGYIVERKEQKSQRAQGKIYYDI